MALAHFAFETVVGTFGQTRTNLTSSENLVYCFIAFIWDWLAYNEIKGNLPLSHLMKGCSKPMCWDCSAEMWVINLSSKYDQAAWLVNYRDHESPLHDETVPRDHHRPEHTVSSDQVPHSSPPHDDGGGRCALTAVLVHPAGQGSEDRENYEMSSPEECLGQHLAHSQVRLRQSREVTI